MLMPFNKKFLLIWAFIIVLPIALAYVLNGGLFLLLISVLYPLLIVVGYIIFVIKNRHKLLPVDFYIGIVSLFIIIYFCTTYSLRIVNLGAFRDNYALLLWVPFTLVLYAVANALVVLFEVLVWRYQKTLQLSVAEPSGSNVETQASGKKFLVSNGVLIFLWILLVFLALLEVLPNQSLFMGSLVLTGLTVVRYLLQRRGISLYRLVNFIMVEVLVVLVLPAIIHASGISLVSQQGDILSCTKLQAFEEGSPREKCIAKAARLVNDIKVCSSELETGDRRILSGTYLTEQDRFNCVIAIAQYRRDAAVCDTILLKPIDQQACKKRYSTWKP